MLTCLQLLCSVLVACVASDETTTIEVKNLQPEDPAPEGSYDYKYYDDVTNEAAEKIKKIKTDTESDRNRFLNETYNSNTALNLLRLYNKDVESVKGTTCEIPKEDRNRYSGAEENIETTVQICDGKITEEKFKDFEKNQTSDLKKIQVYDKRIKTNDRICYSKIIPTAKECVRYKDEVREKIKQISSVKEIEHLSILANKSINKYKKKLKICVDDSNKNLIEMLNDSIKNINDCKTTHCGN